MHHRVFDLTGQKFGQLTVLEFAGYNPTNRVIWKCKCDCGNIKDIKSENLRNGTTKSCGCLKTGCKREILEGMVFNYYTVLAYDGQDNYRTSYFICKCQCGKIKRVKGVDLKTGKIKSCGCYNVEQKKGWIGDVSPSYKYGLSDETRIKRRNFHQFKIWIIEVKKKFANTCQVCSFIGKVMIAHHLYSYINNIDKAILIENGTCLCVGCHKSFHKMFGNRNNTPAQFNTFRIKAQNEK